MSREDLGYWLKGFGVDRFEGRADFDYEGDIPVSLELTGDELALVLTAALFEIDDSADPGLLRHCLMASHRGLATGGFALSIDEAGNALCLWTIWPVSDFDQTSFDAFIGVFLDTASSFRARFIEGSGESETVENDGRGARTEPVGHPSPMTIVRA